MALFPAVGGEALEVADEDLVAADGEVGPSGSIADFQRVDEFEFLGIGLDEEEFSAVVEGEDAVAVGDQRPVVSEGLLGGPEHLLLGRVDAMEAFVTALKVDHAVDDDRRGHVAFDGVVPGGRDALFILFCFHIEEEGAAAVAGGEDAIRSKWGRGEVG